MQTLTIIKGDTLNIPIVNLLPNKTRLNISGYKFFFTMKKKFDDDDDDDSAVFKKSWTTHSNANQGETILTVSSSETSTFDVGSYYADVKWINNSNLVKTPAIFNLIVINKVTNRTV